MAIDFRSAFGVQPAQAPVGDVFRLTHIRQGAICPVVTLKGRPKCFYIIVRQTMTGVILERVCTNRSKERFVPYSILLRLYADIPASILFCETMLQRTFMPIVYINDD